MRLPAMILSTLFVLGGCATAPKPLQGEFSTLSPEQASARKADNEWVRWGGNIVQATPGSDGTCIEILGRELNDSARPSARLDETTGRFLACRSGFYDPAIFAADREVTVTGRVVGFEIRRIGEYDYQYPRVAAEIIYLWPERRNAAHYYVDPFWPHHRGYFWGHWYSPRWVVPVRPRAEPADKG